MGEAWCADEVPLAELQSLSPSADGPTSPPSLETMDDDEEDEEDGAPRWLLYSTASAAGDPARPSRHALPSTAPTPAWLAPRGDRWPLSRRSTTFSSTYLEACGMWRLSMAFVRGMKLPGASPPRLFSAPVVVVNPADEEPPFGA